MPTPTSDRQRQFFVLFLLAMLPAGNALNPCLDVDTWWHLRVGQYIVEKDQLPDHDPFSQLGQEEHVPWVAYSWLYEVLLYTAFQADGFAGILLCRHLLDLMTFCGVAWFLLRHAANGWVALCTLALVTVSLLPFMPERPWHFTILFTTLTLHAVLRIRDGAPVRRFAGLPLLYVLWANIHIQFVMGFAVLGIAGLSCLIEWWRTGEDAKGQQFRGLFLLGVGCAVATLVTPFHIQLYQVIWEYATQTTALELVSELQPPNLQMWWNWPLIVLSLVAAVGIARQGYRLWDLLLFASALFFSLRMQRDLWYGVLATGAIVVRTFGTPRTDERKPSACQILLVTALALLLMRVAWAAGLSQGKTIATCHAESFPVGAVEHIRKHKLAGPLFNNFDWGGYLIWNLSELPVCIDGRTNLYGEERLRRSMNTWQGENWASDPDLQRASIVIAPKKRKDNEFPLTELLRQHSEHWKIEYEFGRDDQSPVTTVRQHSEHWKIEYEDDTAIVFVRVTVR